MSDEKPTKPVEPGPCASPAADRAHAEANAAWSAWIAKHPEDDEPAAAEATPAPAPLAPAAAEVRADGTSPRVRKPAS